MIKDSIFSTLPYYFRKNDSYKNQNGEGLLQRFLGVIGEYFDYLFSLAQSVMGAGSDTGLINPVTTEEQYLEYIAEYVGNPPILYKDEEGMLMYRHMLKYIVTLYHWKGTEKFYKALFGFYGLGVEIEEEIPDHNTSVNRYDYGEGGSVLNYDYEDLRYDEYEPCLPCSVANVYIIGLDIRGDLDNEELIMRIVKILDLYRPINTIFNVFIVNRRRRYILGEKDMVLLVSMEEDLLKDENDLVIRVQDAVAIGVDNNSVLDVSDSREN